MENTKKEELPVIGIIQVLQMLKEGKTREEIRVYYGITKGDLVLLFKHPQLIGKKTIKPKPPRFTVVENENDNQEDVGQPPVEEESTGNGNPDVGDVKAEEEFTGNTAVGEVIVEEETIVYPDVDEAPEQEVAKATWE